MIVLANAARALRLRVQLLGVWVLRCRDKHSVCRYPIRQIFRPVGCQGMVSMVIDKSSNGLRGFGLCDFETSTRHTNIGQDQYWRLGLVTKISLFVMTRVQGHLAPRAFRG